MRGEATSALWAGRELTAWQLLETESEHTLPGPAEPVISEGHLVHALSGSRARNNTRELEMEIPGRMNGETDQTLVFATCLSIGMSSFLSITLICWSGTSPVYALSKSLIFLLLWCFSWVSVQFEVVLLIINIFSIIIITITNTTTNTTTSTTSASTFSQPT